MPSYRRSTTPPTDHQAAAGIAMPGKSVAAGSVAQKFDHDRTGTAWEWTRPGLLAGAMFLAFETVVGTFTRTTWAFPEGIAYTIGIGDTHHPWQPWAPVAGVLVHVTMSVGSGVLFTLIVRKLRLFGHQLVVAAIVFSGMETAFTIGRFCIP